MFTTGQYRLLYPPLHTEGLMQIPSTRGHLRDLSVNSFYHAQLKLPLSHWISPFLPNPFCFLSPNSTLGYESGNKKKLCGRQLEDLSPGVCEQVWAISLLSSVLAMLQNTVNIHSRFKGWKPLNIQIKTLWKRSDRGRRPVRETHRLMSLISRRSWQDSILLPLPLSCKGSHPPTGMPAGMVFNKIVLILVFQKWDTTHTCITKKSRIFVLLSFFFSYSCVLVF